MGKITPSVTFFAARAENSKSKETWNFAAIIILMLYQSLANHTTTKPTNPSTSASVHTGLSKPFFSETECTHDIMITDINHIMICS